MRRFGFWAFGAALAAVVFGLLALLVSIFELKQEARSAYVRVAEIRPDA
jgi:hypothetical protein